MSLEIQSSMESQKQTDPPVSDKELQALFNNFHNLPDRQQQPSLDPKVNEMLSSVVVTCGDNGVVAGIAPNKAAAAALFRSRCLPAS